MEKNSDKYQERMIALVSKIKKGDIIQKLKSGKSH